MFVSCIAAREKHSYLRRSTQAGAELKFDVRRPLSAGEVCPICQEPFAESESGAKLTHCKVGCGNCVHVNCMKIWAEHKISVKEKVSCPLCRVDWGPYALLELRSQQNPKNRGKPKRNDHPRIFKCRMCRACPIVGKIYLCLQCPAPFVTCCEKCFHRGCHQRARHQFAMKTSAFNIWQPALRNGETTRSSASSALVNELQGRELTTNDYHLLLSLDEAQTDKSISFPQYLVGLFPQVTVAVEGSESCKCCKGVITASSDPCRSPCCGAVYHRSCAVDMVNELKQYICPREECRRPLLPGFAYYEQLKKQNRKEDMPARPEEEPSQLASSMEIVGTGQGQSVRLSSKLPVIQRARLRNPFAAPRAHTHSFGAGTCSLVRKPLRHGSRDVHLPPQSRNDKPRFNPGRRGVKMNLSLRPLALE